MLAIRKLVQIIVILGMLLASACTVQPPATSLPNNPGSIAAVTPSKLPSTPSTATPEPLPAFDPAVKAAMKDCSKIVAGQVCLVEGPVKVTAQPARILKPFNNPGQTLNLADIQTLKLGEAGSTRGMVMMLIPTEWPGGAFSVVAFGDVELVNEVPYGTREFNPMQSLKLATGANKEGEAPTSGLFVASPEDGNLSTLVVNGMELSFGSGGFLSSVLGGLTIQTIWGDIAIWYLNRFVHVPEGSHIDMTDEELEQQVLDRFPNPHPADKYLLKLLEEQIKEMENELKSQQIRDEYNNFWEAYWKRMNRKDPMADYLKKIFDKYSKEEANRRKRKPWKGGWWKMTYGPVTTSGQCKAEAAGDGGTGDGKPYTTEIPICRGNNGNTILFYESGVSYDRVGANLFNQSSVSEFDFLGKGNYTTEGHFQTLQVVSPLRMILSNNSTEADGCTTASVVYLDFVRDDPNIRCGKIIYINPNTTPKAPTPTPEPQNVDPPLEGQYKVRIGTLTQACDAQAKTFAPSFTTASLDLSPENNLIVAAGSTQYELELSKLTYPYSSQRQSSRQNRFGIFNLQQPVDNTFGLMMTLVQMPNQQWSGSWTVMNEDATKMCGGSIDLLPPK